MKKTKIMTAVLATVVLLASCKKESNVLNTPEASAVEVNAKQFTFKENTVFSELNNPNDKADHHINVCLYHAGEAMKNTLLSDENKRAAFFDRYQSGENAIKIQELVPEQSVSFTDQKHYNNFSEMEQSMIYRNINYYNVLSFMNHGDARSVLSNSDKFIIAIAVEVSEEDALPGWIIENGIAKETTILEEDLEGDTPIFIVQNSTDHVEYPSSNADFEWEGTPTNHSRTTGPITIDWDSYRIKNGYRYENFGNSELAYEVFFYSGTPPYSDPAWFSTVLSYGLPNIRIDDALIKNISRNQVNSSTLVTDNKTFIANHPADFYDVANAQYHITVYERDWGQSEKSVGNCVGGLKNNVKMKYSHEWYYIDYCGFSAKDSFVGASFTVDNAKCTLQLTRTI